MGVLLKLNLHRVAAAQAGTHRRPSLISMGRLSATAATSRPLRLNRRHRECLGTGDEGADTPSGQHERATPGVRGGGELARAVQSRGPQIFPADISGASGTRLSATVSRYRATAKSDPSHCKVMSFLVGSECPTPSARFFIECLLYIRFFELHRTFPVICPSISRCEPVRSQTEAEGALLPQAL